MNGSRRLGKGQVVVVSSLLILAAFAATSPAQQARSPGPCLYNPTPVVHTGSRPPEIAKPGDQWVNPKDGSVLVAIPMGIFRFGATEDLGLQDGQVTLVTARKPFTATVALAGFWIQRTEVTNAQFAAFVAATGYEPKGIWRRFAEVRGQPRDNYPVCGVTFEDAQAYCDWAGLDLPTEAQWEKAARGYEVDARWPWGAQPSSLPVPAPGLQQRPRAAVGEEVFGANEAPTSQQPTSATESSIASGPRANFNPADLPYPHSGRRLTPEELEQALAPVDAFPAGASPYGVLGLAGNVEEWTCTPYYTADELAESPLRRVGLVSVEIINDMHLLGDPLAAVLLGGATRDTSTVVCRGGGWRDGQMRQTVFYRIGRPTNKPMSLDLQTGFRCVLNRPVMEPPGQVAARPELPTPETVRCSATFRLRVDGQPVTGAKLEQFSVMELVNGDQWRPATPVDLRCEMKQIKGLRIMLVIDHSGSMSTDNRLDQAKQAAADVVRSLGPDDLVGLIIFDDDVSLQRPLGPPDQEILDKIANIKLGGSTAYYDAVWTAVDELRRTLAPDMPCLVLSLSDGKDNASSHSLDELKQHAKDNQVPVHCSGLGLSEDEAQGMLELSQYTGGTYTASSNVNEIRNAWLYAIIIELGADIYTLTWDGILPRGRESEVVIDFTYPLGQTATPVTVEGAKLTVTPPD